MRRNHPLRGQGPASERGAVIVELAFAIPALIAVLAALLWVAALGMHQVRTGDAARVAVRSLARGHGMEQAADAARRVAPGMTLDVVAEGEWVTAIVRHDVPSPLPFLPFTVTLESTATAPVESLL
jgi:hypothetical protein